MLKREDYLDLIQEIRNTEKISLDQYISDVLEPMQKQHPNFIEILYKDISYVLKGIDKKGGNDLMIEDGDFMIEDGDMKLSGYQTRLHDVCIWLHMQMVEKLAAKITYGNELGDKLENFEESFLQKQSYTPEFRAKLDDIKRSLKKERELNTDERRSWFKKLADSDNFELKPNISGIGINLNQILNNFKKP
jgi:hypothetical protein